LSRAMIGILVLRPDHVHIASLLATAALLTMRYGQMEAVSVS
jgi:hypothetical protein